MWVDACETAYSVEKVPVVDFGCVSMTCRIWRLFSRESLRVEGAQINTMEL